MNEIMPSWGRPANVLLVEDNRDDVELTRLGFLRAKLHVNLHHVPSGEECMAFLRKEGEHAEAPRPDLVLLDINMPRMSGIEVLRETDRDETLRDIPMVVLTSSSADEDILKCYKLRCSSYLVKPITFESFTKLIQSLGDYWFTLVVLPSHVSRSRPR